MAMERVDNSDLRSRDLVAMSKETAALGPRRVTPMLVDYLTPNPFQPRLTIDPIDLQPLIDSIQHYGFMGHIEARHDPQDRTLPLQIVFGHRRVEAAKVAGLTTVPVAISERSDEQMRRITFVENSARKALSYWEEARFLDTMKHELGLSIRQIAESLSLSRTYVQERLDLLKLPEGQLRDAAERNDIGFSVAWYLTKMPDQERGELFAQVRRGQLNVTDLRMIRRSHTNQRDQRDQRDHQDQPTQPHDSGNQTVDAPELAPIVLSATEHLDRQAGLQGSQREISGETEGQGVVRPLPEPPSLTEAAPMSGQRSTQPAVSGQSLFRRVSTLSSAVARPNEPVEPERRGGGTALTRTAVAATPPVEDAPGRKVFFDRTLIARHSGRDYAIEAIKQVEANAFYLRQKLAKADFSALDRELCDRLTRAKTDLYDALAQLP